MARRGFAQAFGGPAPANMGMGTGMGMDVGMDRMAKFARSSASGSPGWTCPSCGNMNFADRDSCNMRKCGQPRPQEGMMMHPGLNAGMMCMLPMQPVVRAAHPSSPGGPCVGNPVLGRSGNGGWTCTQCQNTNFGDREFCNMRKCRAPRSESFVQVQQQIPVIPAAGGIPMPEPEGGWTCENCNSVNFADRETCFMRKCGAVRPGLEGIVSPTAPVHPAPAHSTRQPDTGPPHGSDFGGEWECANCGNSNFPDRAFCNMRKCQTIRQLSDWTCGCGNKNFSDRMHCNMRKCAAQRTDIHPKAVAALAHLGKGFGKGSGAMRAQGVAPLMAQPMFGGLC